ncbi:unnamed protein product [Periconia digitata]|uniref:Pentatricopeptide repeat protein n=1 Tax=Periconia digitata TaxID=1303443 RepID=A0A9W4XK17_9PLEO|nr:unnamed protein product [Periconia digitata]
MLALWSRVTRAPGTCRCISCGSTNAALATRASTRATSLLGAPTSTFIYTSIFTVGLAIDAKTKQRRNEQWDTAFEQLHDEIGRLPVNDRKLRSTANSIEAMLSSGIDMDVVHQVAGMELVEGGEEFHDIPQPEVDINHILEGVWDYMPFDTRFPSGPNQNLPWPANTGQELIRYHLPPQSLWSLDHMRWTAVRKRQIWKKLAMQELAIGELIHALLAQASESRLTEKAFASLSPVIRDIVLLDPRENVGARHHIRENMDRLAIIERTASPEEIGDIKAKIKGPGIPSYHQDRDGDFYEITMQMNAAIRKLFDEIPRGNDKYYENQLSLMLARVCHNLLISSAAPDLQTFNILLTGFKRNRLPELVSHVIKTFDRCKIRPNEISCAVILDHYAETDNPDAFSKYVARMRGGYNALMLARPDININERGQNRLIRVNEDKVYQKIHPTPLVFNSLMLGVLRFAGFDRAVDIYFEMKEDGWGLDTLGLSHFLSDCVKRADWNGGVLIWEEISSIKQKIKESHMIKAYADMISLCSVTGNTVAFNHLLNEVVRRGYDRKRIMKSVMAAERRYENGSKVSSAPAWAADNLLIVMSDFMQPDKQDIEDVDSFPEDAQQSEQYPEENGAADAAVNQSTGVEQPLPPALSPEETWNIWLQHELGETPLDDSTPTRNDDLPSFNFDKEKKH